MSIALLHKSGGAFIFLGQWRDVLDASNSHICNHFPMRSRFLLSLLNSLTFSEEGSVTVTPLWGHGLQMPLLVTAIHKSSPMASLDNMHFRISQVIRVLFYFSFCFLNTIYSDILIFCRTISSYYIVGKYSISDPAMVYKL